MEYARTTESVSAVLAGKARVAMSKFVQWVLVRCLAPSALAMVLATIVLRNALARKAGAVPTAVTSSASSLFAQEPL